MQAGPLCYHIQSSIEVQPTSDCMRRGCDGTDIQLQVPHQIHSHPHYRKERLYMHGLAQLCRIESIEK